MDIAIPGQAKVVDIVQKMAMIDAAASPVFKEQNASAVQVVDAKLVELAGALRRACVEKFQKACLGGDLSETLEALLAGNLKTDKVASLLEYLGACKIHVGVNPSTVQKCLGEKGKVIIDMVTSVKNLFQEFSVAVPTVMALLTEVTDKAGQFSTGRLLQEDLRRFVASWAKLDVKEFCREMLTENIFTCVDKLVLKICQGAMLL